MDDPEIRLKIFVSILERFPPGRLLDLGCGHGAFSMLAARLGWAVTAVDVRTERMPKTDGIEWVNEDVRQFQIEPGRYDVIACLGLLYHLELADQLDLLKRCAGSPTIVDTHVSLKPNLKEVGYAGELFDEVGNRTEAQHKKALLSSWGNRTSFWADQPSLLRMFSNSGFATTLQATPWYLPDRTFSLCLPPSDVDVTLPSGDELRGTPLRKATKGAVASARRRLRKRSK